MLKAGIDIGTNTILLLVAEVDANGLRVLEDLVTVVRLGQGVDRNHAFHPDAMERARSCFAQYRKVLDRYPGIKVRAVATSGSRDAKNSEAFFEEIKAQYQIPVEVISGEEEAELSFRGAQLQGVSASEMAVLDIGGGSSELVCRIDSGLLRHSFDMGCVRLSERFLSPIPSAGEIAALREWVRKALQAKSDFLAKMRGKTWVGVAGTATYLASASLGLSKFDPEKVHGSTLSAASITALIDRLKVLSPEERLGIGGMDKGRADVIVAGALILDELLQACGKESLRISVRGLRYGLVT